MSLQEGLVCTLKCDFGKTHSVVYMYQIEEGVLFRIFCKNLPSGLKGFHVHERGNLTQFCKTLGPHYNPDNDIHGGLNFIHSHRGDLGNILVDDDGTCEMTIISHKLRLQELIGRSLVIHQDADDLGCGQNLESKKTGNSGKRLCCGVIGYL